MSLRMKGLVGQLDPVVRLALARAARGAAALGTVTQILAGAFLSVTPSTPDASSYTVSLAPGTSPVARVPDIAALQALTAGAIAIVNTVGAVWTYEAAGALTPDGITVVAATGVGSGQWWRGPTLIAAQAAAQLTWNFDPADASGTASDQNSGLDPTHAVRTWAEFLRRCGTTAPRLSGFALYTFLSSHIDDTDPVTFAPLLLTAAAGAYIEGVLGAAQVVAMGVLSNVTAKNAAANEPLLCQAAGASQFNLVVNTTRASSRGWLGRVTSGAIHVTAQPYAPDTVPTSGFPAQNNAWANGDSFTAYAPININIVQFTPTVTDFPNELPSPVGIATCNIWDPAEDSGLGTCIINNAVALSQVSGTRQVIVPDTNQCFSVLATITNCCLAQGIAILAPYTASFVVGGIMGSDVPPAGFSNSLFAGGTNISGDCVLSGLQAGGYGVTLLGGTAPGGTTISTVYIDKNVVLGATGESGYENSGADTVYGDATAVVDVGHSTRFHLGTMTAWPYAGAFKLNGQTNAYALSAAAGTLTWKGPIALSKANLALAVASGGFGINDGSTAVNPGGASFAGSIQ